MSVTRSKKRQKLLQSTTNHTLSPSPSPSQVSDLIAALTPSPQPHGPFSLPPLALTHAATSQTDMPHIKDITNVKQRGCHQLHTVAVFKKFEAATITIPAKHFHQNVYNMNIQITSTSKDRKQGSELVIMIIYWIICLIQDNLHQCLYHI